MSSIVNEFPDIFGIPKHVYFQTQFGDEPYYNNSTGILAYPLYINNTGNFTVTKKDNVETTKLIPITTDGKKGSIINASGRWSYHIELKEGQLYNTSDILYDQEDPPKKASKHETEKIIEDFYSNEVVRVQLSNSTKSFNTSGIVKSFLKPSKFDVNGSVSIELMEDLKLPKSEQFIITISSLCYGMNIIQDTNYCCAQSYNTTGLGGIVSFEWDKFSFPYNSDEGEDEEIKNPYILSTLEDGNTFKVLYKGKLNALAGAFTDDKKVNKPYKNVSVGVNFALKHTTNIVNYEFVVKQSEPADDGTFNSYLELISKTDDNPPVPGGKRKTEISYQTIQFSHTFSDADIKPTGQDWDNLPEEDKNKNWRNGLRIYSLGTYERSQSTGIYTEFSLPYKRKTSEWNQELLFEEGTAKVKQLTTRIDESWDLTYPENMDYQPTFGTPVVADYYDETKINFFGY